ncbi:MAG: D-alanyl-D-alanine carboxypeptidase family protein [Candidatus Magasanikbacteria bacterium]
MKKIEILKISIFFLFLIFNLKFFTFEALAAEITPPSGFTHLYEENDTYMYNYLSNCTIIPASNQLNASTWQNVNHIQKPQAIIIPKGVNDIKHTYVFFHGRLFSEPNSYPKETVASPTEQDLYKLYTTGGDPQYFLSKQMQELKNANIGGAIFFPRLYQIASNEKGYNIAEKMTKTQYDCFFNEAQAKLKSIPGITYNSTSLTILGHSAGGNTVKKYVTFGYKPNNILLFDACYGDWCQNIIRSNTAQSFFVYYNKNDSETSVGGKAVANMNSPKVKVVATTGISHAQVLSKCFIDHINNSLCAGKGEIMTSAKITTANTTASQNITKNNIVANDLEILQPDLKIKIPGVNFSEVNIDQMKSTDSLGNTWLNIPFLGEYIATVYKYSIVVISLLAVIVIIISGITIVASGGNTDILNTAKKRIVASVISIIVATTSYTLLYLINPNLVNFKSLKILYIASKEYPIEENEYNQIEAGKKITIKEGCDIISPTWDENSFNCSLWNADNDNYPAMGVIEDKCLVEYSCENIYEDLKNKKLANIKTIAEMEKPLCQVAQLAKQAGYQLVLTTSFRKFKDQANSWCTSKYPINQRRSYNALPGGSNHGQGIAVDLLLAQNFKALMTIDSKKMCNVDAQHIKLLADFLYQADPKFVRLETEIWHFEYNTGKQALRGKYDSYPEAKNCK